MPMESKSPSALSRGLSWGVSWGRRLLVGASLAALAACLVSMSVLADEMPVFKLVMAASKTWRRLKGENQLPKVVAGVIFRDGTEVVASPDHRAA